MASDGSIPKTLLIPGAVALVAFVGFLVDRLELTVLQGSGLLTFYTIAGLISLLSAVQLVVHASRGARVNSLLNRIMVLLASFLLILQDWLPAIAIAALAIVIGNDDIVKQRSADEDDQSPSDRFRRSLFAIALSVMAAFGFYMVYYESQRQATRQQIEQERAAVTEIRKLGGFTSVWRPPEFRVTSVGFEESYGNLINGKIVFFEPKITDEGLVHLKALTGLQTLNLDRTKVTDVGLEHLKGLNNLRSLSLNNTKSHRRGRGKAPEGITELQD